MKAPPVPDAFGNYALKGFNEIVHPQDISWIPQTPGWKGLGFILLVLALYYLSRKLRSYYQDRYRREGSSRLKRALLTGDSQILVGEINQVLKLVAMVAYPRDTVASLSGQAWSRFLNHQCEVPIFTEQQQEILASGSYRQISIDAESAQDLIQASLKWIHRHRGAQDA